MKSRYYPKMSFIVFIGVLTLSAAAICRAEEITLTTYYPSPYGVYSEMRLFPKGNPTACDGSQRGLMFYSDGSGSYPTGLYICGSGGWQSFSGYWAANSNDIYNINSGNVGIGGATSPATRLSVRVDGNGANAVLRLSSILSSWTAGYGPRLLFHGGSDDRVFGEIGSFLQNTGTGANAYMAFSTRNAEALGERMRITSDGNVGIGTVPTRRLDVSGGAGTSAAIFEDIPVSAGYGGELFMQARNNAGSRISYASVKAYADDGTTGNEGGSIVFKTTNAVLAEKMRITRDGRVGIGTTNPAENFELSAGGTDDVGLLITAASNNVNHNPFISFRNGNPPVVRASIGVVQGNNRIYLGPTNDVFSSTGIIISSTGSVGIGTTGPTHILDVNGKVRFRGGIQIGTAQVSAAVSGVPPISGINETPVGTSYDFCFLTRVKGRDGTDCEVADLGGGRWRIYARNSFGSSVQCTMSCIQYY